MAAEAEPAEGGEEQEVHIPTENLPEGIAEGDTLVCVGQDETGHTFKIKKAAGETESWEDEARRAMSPRATEEGED